MNKNDKLKQRWVPYLEALFVSMCVWMEIRVTWKCFPWCFVVLFSLWSVTVVSSSMLETLIYKVICPPWSLFLSSHPSLSPPLRKAEGKAPSSGSAELPPEYLTSPLSQQSQVIIWNSLYQSLSFWIFLFLFCYLLNIGLKWFSSYYIVVVFLHFRQLSSLFGKKLPKLSH